MTCMGLYRAEAVVTRCVNYTTPMTFDAAERPASLGSIGSTVCVRRDFTVVDATEDAARSHSGASVS